MKVELEKDSIAMIYINSNPDGKRAIRKELGEQFSEILPVTKRIKSFEEAKAELGVAHESVKMYDDLYWKFKSSSDLLAFIKLRVIIAALNEEWTLDASEETQFWYPTFRHFSPDELETPGAKEIREDMHMMTDHSGKPHGFIYAGTINLSTSAITATTASLTFKSKELAEYAGKQFLKIYADYSNFFTQE